jgi:putative endopeptidase
MKKIFLFLCIAFLIGACKNDASKNTNLVANDVVAANVDTTINPADDFFQFVNGGWLKANPIPGSESNWGIGKVLQKDIYDKMRKVSEAAAANTSAPKGSSQQKIGDYWATGMDTTKIEQQGLESLKEELTAIDAIKDVSGLLDCVAQLQTYGVAPLFGSFVYQDLKKSDQYSYYLWQGGLGLPERDYYFNSDNRNSNIRQEYVKHLANIFKLVGDTEGVATKKADGVFALETFLAKSHRKIEDLRDQYKNYNKMSITDLQKLTPSLSWVNMMAKTGVKTDSVVVGQPEFYKTLEESLTKFSLDDWKAYLKAQLIDSYAGFLSKNVEEENFNFRGKILEGKKEQKPRWKRVLDAQENALGDALGQLFVKEFFPEKAKKRYSDMVEAIKNAYAENIQQLDWMSDSTKAKALDKLKKVSKKVGYPDVWKDFSTMTIDRSSYVRNAINAGKWWHSYNVSKLGNPVNRNEWDMTPQTYNAYYNPSNNEIVLPAAIFMIPGFADDQVDDAVVYGYGGASTIGHEITHGFDDQGRQYDATGNLVAWWLPEDSVKFTQRAQLLVKQFNEYIAVDTMHVRGEATLGENIADLGGVVLGLKAFMKTEQYKKGEKIGGYTPLQRYFMGYALGWMTQQTKERAAQQAMTDVHAPAKLRVNAPFVNIPEFYQAFGIKDSTKMWRESAKRVKIW